MTDMPSPPNSRDDTPTRERKRDMAARLFKQGLAEGESRLKKAVGLGATPNVVPEGYPKFDDQPREVLVGWHPVGGLAGKWFAERTGLGKMITEKINSYPDPTQHWAVLVGDYVHQLWMDENFDVIYTNQKVVIEEWQTFHVGHTRFNDDAIWRTGEMVIAQIRQTTPAYNLISNNCQTYALRLLDAIKADGATQFPTTLNVYKALVGPEKVVDLFKPTDAQVADGQVAAHPVSNDQVVVEPTGQSQQQSGQDKPDESVSIAQKLMNQYTSFLNPKDKEKEKDDEENGQQGSRAMVGEGEGAGEAEDDQGDSSRGAPDGKKKKGGLLGKVIRLVKK